jgi:hypothetical protein
MAITRAVHYEKRSSGKDANRPLLAAHKLIQSGFDFRRSDIGPILGYISRIKTIAFGQIQKQGA